MSDTHPLLDDERYAQALGTILGFQKLKEEQTAHHYEITTGIQPAEESATTVKKLQRLLRHSLNPAMSLECETGLDHDLGAAIAYLHQRIQSEFGLSVDIGCEWEFRARPDKEHTNRFTLDESAYNGTAASNALHVNISLKDADGVPAMLQLTKDGALHVNRTCYNVACGLREVLEATPLWSATDDNSFRRFANGKHAPKYYDVSIGKDGESAVMIRTCKGSEDSVLDDSNREYVYIENRIPNGDIDPQIAIFQSLLGVYHGLNRQTYLLADAEAAEQTTPDQFLGKIKRYGFSTVQDYLDDFGQPSLEAVLKREKDDCLKAAALSGNPEPQRLGRGISGKVIPASVSAAREMQQSATILDYYIQHQIVLAETAELISSVMTGQRIPSDGSVVSITKTSEK